VVIKDYNATAERFYQMYGFNQTAATGAAGGRSHGQSVVSLGDEIGVMRTGLDTDFIKCDPPNPFPPGNLAIIRIRPERCCLLQVPAEERDQARRGWLQRVRLGLGAACLQRHQRSMRGVRLEQLPRHHRQPHRPAALRALDSLDVRERDHVYAHRDAFLL